MSERPSGRTNPDVAPTDTHPKNDFDAPSGTDEPNSSEPDEHIEPISAIESATAASQHIKTDTSRTQDVSDKSATRRSGSVGRKIGLVVAMCLALAVAIAATGISQMYSIGVELEAIAKRDVPLTNAVSAITVHQLEQAVNFERAMRFGEEMQTNPDVRPKFEETKRHFGELSQKVNKELKDGEELAKNAAATAATTAARDEFEHVLKQLTKIEHEHKVFEQHAAEAFELVSNGQMSQAHQLTEKIVAEEDKIDHELEALLIEIEKFTVNAAKTAEAHEKTAVTAMIALSVIGFVVVTLLAWQLVTRTISRPLTAVAGALNALTEGDTSVEIAVKSNDEIGKVASALNTFRDHMIESERLRAERQAVDERARAEKARMEAERREAEDRARDEKARIEEEKRQAELKAEKERLAAEERAREEKARIEEERRVAEAKIEQERREAEDRAREERARVEQEKLEAEAKAERERLEAEKRAQEEKRRLEEEQRRAEAEAKERAEQERREAMMELAQSFQERVGNVITSVADSSNDMKSAAKAMSATADLTSQQSTTVAATSEQASANVQTVAAASEELAASVTEISRQVTQSAAMAREAVADAQQTDTNIQGLAEAANRIGEVINMINDIASQTNLLALNATIEAARAGDAGKGFAVVASEVKSLADQTAKATEEIASQIGGMQSATTDAVAAVRAIGKKINEIDEISSAIAAAVEEQGASTNEIAKNVQQAATGTQSVSENIAQVTQAAGETGSAASQVLSTAENLSLQSDELRNSVEKFLEEVRAA